MSERIKQQKEDIPSYSISQDMLWFWFQIRNLYEEVKNKIKNLISKK